jgi:hypothetical protein
MSQITNTKCNQISLRDFYSKAANVVVPCQDNLFIPDHWTKTLASGLEKVDLANKNVLEVGVGIGINMLGLMTSESRPAYFIGTDICTDAITLSQKLADTYSLPALSLRSNLLQNLDDNFLSKIHEIFACIPQVPACLDLNTGDNAAHYYIPNGDSWDDYGLGLNAQLLEQATNRAPQAGITLNLSGRPGVEKLSALFKESGREGQIVHETIVPQHIGTSLETLAKMEGNGHGDFEFFRDAQGKESIGARIAEERRISGQDVYHKIYVFHAPGLN